MTDQWRDVHDTAANLSRWLRHLKAKTKPTSAWVGALIGPRLVDEDANPLTAGFVPMLRVDDTPEHRTKKNEPRVTLRECEVLLPLDQTETYISGTSFKQITLGGRPFLGTALATPDPEVADICYGQACEGCPRWFVCVGAQVQAFGTLHRIEISSFHFRKRTQDPNTGQWANVGRKVTGIGAKVQDEPLTIAAPLQTAYFPQFIKEDTPTGST